MSEEKKPTATKQVAAEVKSTATNQVVTANQSVQNSSVNYFGDIVGTKTFFAGIHHKAGEFKDEKTGNMISYDNLEISLLDVPDSSQNTMFCYGFEACIIKIKASNAGSVFGYSDFESDFDPELWLGKEVDIRYDKKGKVKSIVRV